MVPAYRNDYDDKYEAVKIIETYHNFDSRHSRHHSLLQDRTPGLAWCKNPSVKDLKIKQKFFDAIYSPKMLISKQQFRW